ncbi:MAG: tol-pal system-associated acyl-CoA thioesterase [Hahellaceae bacterium]|nr:tol-pal system-associated acyl-CoA thioesterase [Hahellaceae bacterium]
MNDLTSTSFATPDGEFHWPVRVYIEDTDAGGIVFYANYLKFMERARTEFVRSLGLNLREGLRDNISYVVAHLDVRYIKSALLDDELTVSVSLAKQGRVYMQFDQKITNKKNELLVTGHVKVACVELCTGKPRPLPESLIAALNARRIA